MSGVVKDPTFGLIFHWGLYSVPAYDSIASARRRRTQNGSEWYLRRLQEKGAFRPISGYKEAQEYHLKHYGDADYDEAFRPVFLDQSELWCPEEWMKLVVEVGASYVILTARHHDGFCLWPTVTTDNRGSRDYVGEFCDAAQKAGLSVGLYYSWYEFGKSVTVKYFDQVIRPQIEELRKYNPAVWWFDGHWELKSQSALKSVSSLIKSIRNAGENVQINDRLGGAQYKEDPLYLGDATYRVYEDRALPEQKPSVPWEHINTIGLSWGYNRDQDVKDYKTARQLKELRAKVSDLGGYFLLNLGPRADGSLDKHEATVLREAFQQ